MPYVPVFCVSTDCPRSIDGSFSTRAHSSRGSTCAYLAAERGSRQLPVAMSLHVGSTVAPQPRRPGVAEGMEAHKPQPVRRDAAFFLRLVSSSVLGSERHRRSILPERRREPRHSPAANSALYEV